MRNQKWMWTMAFLALPIWAVPGRGASVSASASSYQVTDGQTGPTTANAHIVRQEPGAPGSSEATAGAAFGALSGVSTMIGCGFAFNNFQQVCNTASSGSSYSDEFTILANAPNGTPVQIRATLSLIGSVDGIGGYFYQVNVQFNGMGVGINDGTGGAVQTVNGLSLDDTQVRDYDCVVGGHYSLTGNLGTSVLNRYCASGSGSCDDSDSEWEMTLSAAILYRLEVLTPGLDVSLVSQSGHDYLAVPVGVGSHQAVLAMAPAWPNPSRGAVNLSLALAEPTSVDVGVFDLAGRRVATLANETMVAGTRPLRWDARDAEGREARGMFFIRARGPNIDLTRRVLIVR